MGRLIDADALKAAYGMKDDCNECERAKRRECEYNYCYSKMNFCEWIDDAETVEAIPISYINSRISRLRQHKTYAGDFGADFLEAVIKDYNKEAHND